MPIFEKLAGLNSIKKSQVAVDEAKKEASSAEVTPEKKPQAAKPQRPGVLPPLGVSIKRTTPTPSVTKAAVAAQGIVPTPVTVQDNMPIDIERMRLVWLDFANTQTSSVSQTLRTAIPDLQNNTEILITIDNAFQQEKVEDIKPILLPYLRKALNNDKITVVIHVSKSLKTNKAFTPKEKLQELMRKNKDLNDLVIKLGLELD